MNLVRMRQGSHPLPGRLTGVGDGNIIFMGRVLSPEEAVSYLTKYIWQPRSNVSRASQAMEEIWVQVRELRLLMNILIVENLRVLLG